MNFQTFLVSVRIGFGFVWSCFDFVSRWFVSRTPRRATTHKNQQNNAATMTMGKSDDTISGSTLPRKIQKRQEDPLGRVGDDDAKAVNKRQQPKLSSKAPRSGNGAGGRSRGAKPTAAVSTKLLLPWLLSVLLAISLFQTFTYMPPEVAEKHPHINHFDAQKMSTSGTKAETPQKDGEKAVEIKAKTLDGEAQIQKKDTVKKPEITSKESKIENPEHEVAKKETEILKEEPAILPTEKEVEPEQALAQDVTEKQPAIVNNPNADSGAGAVQENNRLSTEAMTDIASLQLPMNATSIRLNQIPENHPMLKNPILSVLKEAHITEIAIDEWKALPDLATNLSDLYGYQFDGADSGPVVLGMESCEAYRNMVPPKERYTAAAGMFNTGTNALETHLRKNILRVDSVWQVPWGKHRMEWVRLKHVASGMKDRNQSQCLPIVIVRDPYHWMQSMVSTA